MEITFSENKYYIKIDINKKYSSVFSKNEASNLSLFLPGYDLKKTLVNRDKFFKSFGFDKKCIFNPELEHFNRFYFASELEDESYKVIEIIPFNKLMKNLFENYYKIKDFDKFFNNDKNSFFIERQVNTDSFENKNGNFLNFHPLADAAGTDSKKIIPMITYADCTPLSLFVESKDKTITFSIHSGWRSTCINITGEIIKWISNKFNVKKNDFVIVIGPAIKGENYEVKENIFYQNEFLYLIKFLTEIYNKNEKPDFNEQIRTFPYYSNSNSELINVYNKIKDKGIYSKNEYLILLFILNRFFKFSNNGKMFFDYKKLLLWMLQLEKIKNIVNLDIDTYTDKRFSSYRRDKKKFIAQGLISFNYLSNIR